MEIVRVMIGKIIKTYKRMILKMFFKFLRHTREISVALWLKITALDSLPLEVRTNILMLYFRFFQFFDLLIVILLQMIQACTEWKRVNQ